MDYETGEDFQNRTTDMDHETGESPATPKVDSETGETELNRTQPEPTVKKPFKIPVSYSNISDDKKNSAKRDRTSAEEPTKKVTYALTETTSNSAVLLFLLPTIFFFIPAISIPLGIIEVVLHTWAHKKNKHLRDTGIYYQSPLHVFVSEFCAACRFETTRDKIAKMQDKRNRRYKIAFDDGIEYVRSIV